MCSLQLSWTRRCVPIREVSSFQRVLCTVVNELGPEDVSLLESSEGVMCRLQ